MSLSEAIESADQLGDEEAVGLLASAAEAELSKREPRRADVANLLLHLAAVHERLGAHDQAEARVREAIRLYRRACGNRDARTRHAQLELGHVLRRAGKKMDALRVYEAFEPRRRARPAWLAALVEELRRELGNPAGVADLALDDLLASTRRELKDAMVHSGSFVNTANRLATLGRASDGVALLEEALVALEEIAAGKRVSISARVPAQVIGEVRAALAQVRAQASPPPG